MKVYEYVIYFNPVVSSSLTASIVRGPEAILAKDEREALIIAARNVPEEFKHAKIGYGGIEIEVKPFSSRSRMSDYAFAKDLESFKNEASKDNDSGVESKMVGLSSLLGSARYIDGVSHD